MIPPGRLDHVLARLLVGALLAVALTAVMLSLQPAEPDQSVAAYYGVAVLLVWMLMTVYELPSLGLAKLVARVRPRRGPGIARSRGRESFSAVGAVAVYTAYLGGMIAVGMVSALTVVASGAELSLEELEAVGSSHMPWLLPLSVVAGAGAAWFVFRRMASSRDLVVQRRLLAPCSGRQLALSVLGGAVFAVAFALFVARLVPVSDTFEAGELARMASTPGLPRVMWVITGVALAPVVEELLFRGVVLEGLINSLGVAWAVVLSTALFASAHFAEIWGMWPAVLAVTGGGAALAVLRIHTQRLAPAVAAHVTYNLVITSMAWT